jgi:hypothetical protein
MSPRNAIHGSLALQVIIIAVTLTPFPAAATGPGGVQRQPAAAKSERSGVRAWLNRKVTALRTRVRLGRQYSNVLRVGQDLVVSNDKDLLARETTEGGEASGEATVVDRLTGVKVRPIRLLRRSHAVRLGPSRDEAIAAIQSYTENHLEILDYQPEQLKLTRAGSDWMAEFEGYNGSTRGEVRLELSRNGRWYLDEDIESGNWAKDDDGWGFMPAP